MNRIFAAACLASCLPALAFGGSESGRFARPPASTHISAEAGPKYRQPAAGEILRNRRQALDWGERARQSIAPGLHLVESKHFLIFSTWSPGTDRSLAGVCEEMYNRLLRQFNLAATEPVWVGKCPIYIFLDSKQYLRFATEIDRRSARQKNLTRTAGYHASQNGFAYIVLNGVRQPGRSEAKSIQRFYEVLVHEGSHAFLDRYVSPRPIPVWVEEGLADYMAASLVPGADAGRDYIEATRRTLTGRETVSDLFRKKDLSPRDYGVAQSLVRYLLAANRDGFVKFILLMKQGQAWEKALALAYQASPEDLVRAWSVYWRRALTY